MARDTFPGRCGRGKNRDAQALFEESLRQMMPLGQGQIQEYRSRSDERDRALLPVSPNEKGTHGVSSGNTVLEENDSADLLRRDSDGRGGKSYRFTIRPT